MCWQEEWKHCYYLQIHLSRRLGWWQWSLRPLLLLWCLCLTFCLSRFRIILSSLQSCRALFPPADSLALSIAITICPAMKQPDDGCPSLPTTPQLVGTCGLGLHNILLGLCPTLGQACSGRVLKSWLLSLLTSSIFAFGVISQPEWK